MYLLRCGAISTDEWHGPAILRQQYPDGNTQTAVKPAVFLPALALTGSPALGSVNLSALSARVS